MQHRVLAPLPPSRKRGRAPNRPGKTAVQRQTPCGDKAVRARDTHGGSGQTGAVGGCGGRPLAGSPRHRCLRQSHAEALGWFLTLPPQFSGNRLPERGTVLTRPQGPRIGQRVAAPWPPRNTCSEPEETPVFAVGCICKARAPPPPCASTAAVPRAQAKQRFNAHPRAETSPGLRTARTHASKARYVTATPEWQCSPRPNITSKPTAWGCDVWSPPLCNRPTNVVTSPPWRGGGDCTTKLYHSITV